MSHNSEKKNLTSFDKSYSANIFFNKPDKYREIEKLSKSNQNIITTGSNYSYAPIGFDKNSTSLDLSSFNRVLDFNVDKKEITVEAGLKIYDFLKFTLKYNLWLPQVPGYPFITLGGIVATNSHGKSCGTHGTVRKSIKNIKLFHKNNGWLNLSDYENKEIFDLTIGGFGLTGTIVSITFKLTEIESGVFETHAEEVKSFSDCYKKISNEKDQNTFTYSWNRADNLKNFGNGFIYKNKLKKNSKNNNYLRTIEQKRISNFLPLSLWNSLSLNLVNNIYYKVQKMKKKKLNEDLVQVIFPYIGRESYFKFFGPKGFIESQLLVPSNNVEVFMDEFLNIFKKHTPIITLFSLKNMQGEHKNLRFEDNSVCISFDFTNTKKNIEFMILVDKLCIKYKAIPSIIKDSRLDKKTVSACYVQYEDFKDRLKKYDNKRVYQSAISNKLGL
tara:strand:- start:1496 stop:2824 length:1329 start_codon:yes stop_codon:yes gene_type:complete